MAYKSIRHHGPDIWNALPDNIKHSATLFSFKASMKKYLISKYAQKLYKFLSDFDCLFI